MTDTLFYTFIITSGAALILAIARMMYRSKCSNFELCCLKIERNIEQEGQTDTIIQLARRLSGSEPEPVSFPNVYHKVIQKKIPQPVLKEVSTVSDLEMQNVALGGS